METYFSIADVAIRLDVHPTTVRRLIHRGQLRAVKLGAAQSSTIRISEAALSEFLARQMVPAA
jgi:excisionase family DNA binding protein